MNDPHVDPVLSKWFGVPVVAMPQAPKGGVWMLTCPLDSLASGWTVIQTVDSPPPPTTPIYDKVKVHWDLWLYMRELNASVQERITS